MPPLSVLICWGNVSSWDLEKGMITTIPEQGRDADKGISLLLFTRLALVTTLSFVILFLPLLPPFAPMSTLAASITRIFPFSRGLFEDKVANFWCFTNVTVLKWKRLFEGKERFLIKCSTVLTAFGFLPAVAGLLWGGYKTRLVSSPSADQRSQLPTPTLPLLHYALLTSSMSFFLFSFQVHEKSILLPLLPLTLLLSSSSSGDEVFAWASLGNIVGVFRLDVFVFLCSIVLTNFTACGHC